MVPDHVFRAEAAGHGVRVGGEACLLVDEGGTGQAARDHMGVVHQGPGTRVQTGAVQLRAEQHARTAVAAE